MTLATPTAKAAQRADADLSAWRERLRTARRLSFALSILAAVLSSSILLFGWLFDIAVVRRLPGHPGMAITAAAGALACAVLLMRSLRSPSPFRRSRNTLPAAVLLAVALADLVLLAINPRWALDRALFSFSDARSDIYMSPATAVCLALSALCLVIPLGRGRFWRELFGLLVATGLAVTVFAATGYLFDSAALRDVFVFSAMSPQTALVFLLIFLALAGSQPAYGWMQILLGPRPGSATLRRTLPFVVIGPFALCWTALLAVDHGIFNANFRLSLVAIAGATGLIVLLFWSAQRENTSARYLLQSNRRLREALAERDTLLREVYHRVKNNLQFFDAMLALEAAKPAVSADEAKERLEAIRKRVHALALVHQQLIDTRDMETLNLRSFLGDLCIQLSRGIGLDERRILVRTNVPDLQIGFERAVPIGLIVTELFSNAAKHAFPNGRKGTISVEAEVVANRMLTLRIGDDGIGLAGGTAEQGHAGNLIVTSLVEQLKAQMELEDRHGLHVAIHIPICSTSGHL